MKVVFIAGPLVPAAGAHPVAHHRIWFENVERAKAAALEVLGMGAIPIVPHTNTGWAMGRVDEGPVRSGYRTILARCDAVFMLEGWTESRGASMEHDEARSLGIPVFDRAEVNKLRKFIKGAADGTIPV